MGHSEDNSKGRESQPDPGDTLKPRAGPAQQTPTRQNQRRVSRMPSTLCPPFPRSVGSSSASQEARRGEVVDRAGWPGSQGQMKLVTTGRPGQLQLRSTWGECASGGPAVGPTSSWGVTEAQVRDGHYPEGRGGHTSPVCGASAEVPCPGEQGVNRLRDGAHPRCLQRPAGLRGRAEPAGQHSSHAARRPLLTCSDGNSHRQTAERLRREGGRAPGRTSPGSLAAPHSLVQWTVTLREMPGADGIGVLVAASGQ